MNSLVRSDIIGTAVLADVDGQLSIPETDGGWADRRVSVTMQSGLPLSWLNGMPRSQVQSSGRRAQLVVKRGLDVVGALVALVLVMPLLAVVAVGIMWTSRGPVLFKQQREGINGRMFEAFKFRSMRIDACDPSGVAQTSEGDPRVTPIGKFIRRTSIDELPQLINVLRGDMSLVGPRPHVPGMRAGGTAYRILVPYYDQRLVMRPGITGWAQANGLRGPTVDAAAAIARVDHDMAYVENFSLWLDVKIIAKTIVGEFVTGSGH
jgi:lipopolysaccharide/colanic/teichoic acid biosynthesis glycosyltransferase